MKRKLFSLVTLLLCAVTGAWAENTISATQTFKTQTVSRDSCEWSNLSATVAKGESASGDGLYFVAGGSNVSNTSGAFGKSAWTIYLKVPSATSNGYVTMVSNSTASDRPLYLNSYNKDTNPTAKIVCHKSGSRTSFTAADVVNVNGGYYIQLSNTDKADVKIKTIGVLLNSESYPVETVDPVFSLTNDNISTAATSQIQVGSKAGLDGITLTNISYTTSGVVTVDAETGVVTPVAAGTTTINFDSEAVAEKYNASTSNSVTITVREAVPVFDGAGLTNQEIILSQENVEYNDYLSCNVSNWVDKTTWSAPYDGFFLDMKNDRKISVKVKNVYAFEFFVNGTSGRKYTIKVGDATAVEYTQGSGTYVSSGVIATGTTGEVTLVIEGGSNTLYPVYIKLNPAESVTVSDKLYRTYASTSALTFPVTGLTAYKATVVGDDVTFSEVTGDVPAGEGLLLKATTAGTFDIPVAAGTPGAIDNALVGVTAAETIAAGSFILYADATHPIGFYKTGAAFDAGANTAYLPADASPAREFIGLDGDATGIKAVEAQKQENGEYYNLAGQRVAQPTKGLYIVNGKKYIVK